LRSGNIEDIEYPPRSNAEKYAGVCLGVWWKLMRPIGEANGYVHRLIDHSIGEFSDTKGNRINDLEGFWGYRKAASKENGFRCIRLNMQGALIIATVPLMSTLPCR